MEARKSAGGGGNNISGMASAVASEESAYTAKDIQVLEDLEAVRKRPAMYIGDTGSRGLHHLLNEVLDNSIDEVSAGFCDAVEVILHSDGSATVCDNGRGIPVDFHEEFKAPAVQVVLTKLHAGGKFGSKAYKVAGGLHGVGISVVNALSSWLEVTVKRNGKIYWQKYERGKPVCELKEFATFNEYENAVKDADSLLKTAKTGTKIRFKPDSEIFRDTRFDFSIISERLRELAFLNEGLSLSLLDERSGEQVSFKYDGGIASFVEYLNKNKRKLHEPLVFKAEKNGIIVEIGMQYSSSYAENILSFVNNVKTVEGGTHLSGFKSALTRVLNEYARERGFLKKKLSLEGEDVREGLSAVISVKMREPQFEGQTKTKLGNAEVRGVVESVVREHLRNFLEEHPREAEEILMKAISAAKAREAARQARELARRKEAVSVSMPGKLADCSERDIEKREIFIVEGDSAGGSAKQARDKNFQAVLPIRGKILNVEKANMEKILKNNEIRALITALGAGIGEDFDIKKVRYGKVIIMSDADVDGAHIRTLLLTLFYRYMRPLIAERRVYIALPPLYMIQKGKERRYAFSEEEARRILADFGEQPATQSAASSASVASSASSASESKGKVRVQRYKGLGEMNPEQLWETTMNPATRCLKLVTLRDAEYADRIFSVLMGEDVEPRKNFIQNHAKEVVNLDV
ncbi:MAG: DNA topoisomerase (ATP-hydrolyzing) subunit B [Candidatus Methanospirare jalkutatii]|nr:DNA topoisomerase (ATP-hydrolyzing) subunit B [Candidatus Methanospirare jalkutatii]